MADEDDVREPRPAPASHVVLGSIKAVFGTRGWVKVHSETRPRDGIFDYARWQLGLRHDWQAYALDEGRVQGPTLLAKLRGVDDRASAEQLIGRRIAVEPADLPPPPDGSYYWRDLLGLRVIDTNDCLLGTVQGLVETGSSDVLRVKGEREYLIPFVTGRFVTDVDLAAGRITVDWQESDD